MDVQPRVPERWKARVDLAAACRLSVNREGTRFLTDPKAILDEEGSSHAS